MSGTDVVNIAYDSLGQGLETAQRESANDDQLEALRIWSDLRSSFPDHPAAFQRAAAALTKLARYDEAENLLCQGRTRFPNDVTFAIDQARLSHAPQGMGRSNSALE